LRVRRKLNTLRGNACDLLEDSPKRFFVDRDAFYRRALMQGLDYHRACDWGELGRMRAHRGGSRPRRIFPGQVMSCRTTSTSRRPLAS
jgi:hypothetical protein